MHTQAIEYVVTKYSQAEQANDKAKKSRVPAFFKGLAQLLWATSPKESLKVSVSSNEDSNRSRFVVK